jgi:hypothetical protein
VDESDFVPYLSDDDKKKIDALKDDYEAAQAVNDQFGMYMAHAKAEHIRHKAAGLVIVIDVPRGGV